MKRHVNNQGAGVRLGRSAPVDQSAFPGKWRRPYARERTVRVRCVWDRAVDVRLAGDAGTLG